MLAVSRTIAIESECVIAARAIIVASACATRVDRTRVLAEGNPITLATPLLVWLAFWIRRIVEGESIVSAPDMDVYAAGYAIRVSIVCEILTLGTPPPTILSARSIPIDTEGVIVAVGMIVISTCCASCLVSMKQRKLDLGIFDPVSSSIVPWRPCRQSPTCNGPSLTDRVCLLPDEVLHRCCR